MLSQGPRGGRSAIITATIPKEPWSRSRELRKKGGDSGWTSRERMIKTGIESLTSEKNLLGNAGRKTGGKRRQSDQGRRQNGSDADSQKEHWKRAPEGDLRRPRNSVGGTALSKQQKNKGLNNGRETHVRAPITKPGAIGGTPSAKRNELDAGKRRTLGGNLAGKGICTKKLLVLAVWPNAPSGVISLHQGGLTSK